MKDLIIKIIGMIVFAFVWMLVGKLSMYYVESYPYIMLMGIIASCISAFISWLVENAIKRLLS